MQIIVKEPTYSDDFYKLRTKEAYYSLAKKDNLKLFLDVVASLCKQAYLKGRHDQKMEQIDGK